jgi:hypothetical protein
MELVSSLVSLYGCETVQDAERNIWTQGRGITGCWRRLRCDELYNLCSTRNIVKVIILRRMRPVGNVTHMVETKKNGCTCLV